MASHSSASHRRGTPSLARTAEESMLRERMFPTGSRCLVMLSGGQDSLTLLHLLSTGKGRKGHAAHVHALHINHHLRGEESDADEALVVRACGLVGVSLTVAHCPIEKAGGNVQEAARDARRSAALATAAEQGCDRIALGHTADDQVETMLYRLGRYGGLASFAAMRACDPPWVRPLLDCRRAETAAYCREHGLEFARDRGNAYPGYARTAIREEVVPAWEAALPGAVEAACRAAGVAAEMQELVAASVADAAPKVVVSESTALVVSESTALVVSESTALVVSESTALVVSDPAAPVVTAGALDTDRRSCDLARAERLSVSALLALEPALRRLVLHTWLEGRARPAASRAGVLAVESLLEVPGSAHRSLAGGCRAVKEYDRLGLVCGRGVDQAAAQQDLEGSPSPVLPPAALPLAVPGEVEWQGTTIRAERVAGFTMPDVAREVFVDAASLPEPLSVRGHRPGDRFRPFGAPGTRKLQDVFVDLRVPAAQRSSWPLVMSGKRIVWVCGLVQAEEGRIAGHTKDIVRLSWGRT